MACPNPSTLKSYCVGGQIQTICEPGIDPEGFGEIVVTAQLINPTGGIVCDPTSGAFIASKSFQNIIPAGNDGCWCTCPLWVNFADDPDEALQPGDTSWQITVVCDGVLIGEPVIFRLDGDADYSVYEEDYACGSCINIKGLIPPLPTSPPTSAFCTATYQCLGDITGTSADGTATVTVTGDYENGWNIDVVSPVTSVSGLAAGDFSYVDELGAVTTVVVNSNDANNVISEGPDGGLFLDCAAIKACETVTTLVDNADGSFTFTSEDGTVTTWAETPLVLTTDGDATGVIQSGTSDHIVDIVITSADTGNLAFIGIDGGTYVSCTEVLSCINAQFDSSLDPADGDPVPGTGTPTDPFLFPIETVTSLVDNGDGTWTYTNEDGVTTDISGGQSSLADNGDGTLTHTSGDGTAVTVNICDLVEDGGCIPALVNNNDGTYTFSDGFGNSTIIDINEIDMDINNISVVGSVVDFTAEDGTVTSLDICAIVSAQCDSTLVANADGSFTHTSNSGVDTIIPAPAAETVTTLVDNGDNTFTYTSENGTQTTFAVDLGPVSSYVNNGDGTITLDPGDGSATTTVDICQMVADGGCTDSLVVNADGSITHTALDGTVVTFTPGTDTNVEYVPFDPLVHVAGPAVGDGSTGDPFEVPIMDVCDTLANLGPADCTTPLELVTNDCTVVSVEDLQPVHVYASCTRPEETFTSFAAASAPEVTSMVETARYQIGRDVPGGQAANAIPVADVAPLCVTLPPTTADTQMVQISWGGNPPGLGRLAPVIDSVSGDIANATLLGFTSVWGGLPSTHGSAFAVDVTGPNGGEICFTFPEINGDDDGAVDGVIQWYSYDATGFSVADLAIGSTVTTTAVNNNAGNVPGDGFFDAPAIDMGDCDAVYFGVARHVRGISLTTNDFVNLNKDVNWSTFDTAVSEVLDVTSFDTPNGCQLGSTSGFIPAGTGSTTFTYESNSQAFVADEPASWFAVPLNCTNVVGGNTETAECVLDVTNPVCNPDSMVQVDITGGACISAAPGAHLCVTPVVNGVSLTASAFEIDNTAGTQVQSVCSPIQITEVIAGPIAPGATQNVTVKFVAAEKNGSADPANSVTVRDMSTEVELFHI